MKNRAIRRHHIKRIKDRLRRRWEDTWNWSGSSEEDKESFINHHINNRTPCSCWMCQNPRRIKHRDNRTRDEKLMDISEKEEIEEVEYFEYRAEACLGGQGMGDIK